MVGGAAVRRLRWWWWRRRAAGEFKRELARLAKVYGFGADDVTAADARRAAERAWEELWRTGGW